MKGSVACLVVLIQLAVFGAFEQTSENYVMWKSSGPRPTGSNVKYAVGSYVSFRCPAMGHPRPTIQWFKNNQPIDANTNLSTGSKIILRRWKITLARVGLNDHGVYRCEVSNGQQTKSNSWTLTVTEAPLSAYRAPIINTTLLTNQTVREGETVVWQCKGRSVTNVHYTWLLPHRNGPDGELLGRKVNTSMSSYGVLVLPRVKMSDAGHYTCLAMNPRGASHYVVWLTVLPKIQEETVKLTV